MAKIRALHRVKSKKIKKKLKFKKSKSKITEQKPSVTRGIEEIKNEAITNDSSKAEVKKVVMKDLPTEELAERFPIFKNEELVRKFLSVTITNNQKGRIRQILRDNLKGISGTLLPDVIHNRIVAISKGTDLTDAELRKMRILYNMLKTSLQSEKVETNVTKKSKKKRQKTHEEKKPNSDTVIDTKEDKKDTKEDKKDTKEEDKKDTSTTADINEVKTIGEKSDMKDVTLETGVKTGTKLKGPKRYVVFVGHLPLDIDKEKIMAHFSDVSDNIVDVRIPKQIEGKRNRVAYLELKNEPTFELALSKNHSMLCNKRIIVQYSVQKNSKITVTQAKGKAAKLSALQKSGKLIGSIPASRKRSHRRMKAKAAKAAQEA